MHQLGKVLAFILSSYGFIVWFAVLERLLYNVLFFLALHIIYHVLQYISAELAVIHVLTVHQWQDEEKSFKQGVGFKYLDFGNDMLGQLLTNMIETKGSRLASINVTRKLIA